MKFTAEEIARATGGILSGNSAAQVRGVSTDSRKIVPEELFVALHGDNFDGHDFITVALENGAAALLVNKEWSGRQSLDTAAACVAVADTLRALGDLAAFHRRRFEIPLVGITGSNGKTTTKEMLAAILALTGQGLKTSGNLNNLIGLPQMLLQLSGSDRWAVLEMGMSEPGEIDRLAEIAAPRVGVITNAFRAHLASMGSVEAVAKAKGELFLRLPEDGWAIYNADDPLVAACPVNEGVNRLSFGLHKADVTAMEIRSLGLAGQSFFLRTPDFQLPITLKAYGQHNIYNALAAASAALALGIEPQLIKDGLEVFTPYDKRFHLEEVNGIVLIDDSYNANPASMAAALVTLRELRLQNRSIAILGDMLELGADSEGSHRSVGELAAFCADRIYLLGDSAELVAAGALAAGFSEQELVRANNHDEIIADLRRQLKPGDYVLVKGSRGMRMEAVATVIRSGFNEGRGGA